MRLLQVCVAVVVVCAVAVCAQPEEEAPPPTSGSPVSPSPVSDPAAPSDSSPAAGSMEVAAHLWAVIGRYRFAATADRVRVTLVQPSGRSDMLSFVVRCVPGAAGLVRLELGELIVVARQGEMRAVHAKDPTTFVELRASAESTGPAGVVRELLPPLALPQLSLAFDPAEVDWCPLVTGLRWESAERLLIEGHDGVRLRGRTDIGEARLDLAGGRVRRFEADLDTEGTRLIIECEPFDPGDPAEWVLEVEGRRMVDRLEALRPLGARVRVGERLPRIEMLTVDTQEELVLGGDPDAGLAGKSRLHAVLLLRDDAPAAETEAIVASVLAGMTECRRELLRGRIDGRYAKRVRLVDLVGVIQAETSGGILDRLNTQAEAWHRAAGSVLPAESVSPVLAWQADGSRLLDRLSPGARAVLVMHDDRGTIRAVLPMEAETSSEAVRDALVAGVPGIQE
ncbi:hypothetical protein MNBD_PLANCTO03-179 [hydrothermal vent metagenome]|uniref:Uncharacterized protein n=1 Tax=hydrothermal vent metagenome TaxID=652676 RepID=A0A3B1DZQ6_9ZZZZ